MRSGYFRAAGYDQVREAGRAGYAWSRTASATNPYDMSFSDAGLVFVAGDNANRHIAELAFPVCCPWGDTSIPGTVQCCI